MKKFISKSILTGAIAGAIMFYSCGDASNAPQEKIDWAAYNDSVKKALSDSLDKASPIIKNKE